MNRARCMPQNPIIIATKTVSGEIHTFNINLSYKNDAPKPEQKLTGHSSDGYGLCWNPSQEGLLISGANDY